MKNRKFAENINYKTITVLLFLFTHFMVLTAQSGELKKISQEELKNKIAGYWIGQMVGNFMGFPFENKYVENTCPADIMTYNQYDSNSNLKINNDIRGYAPQLMNWLQGAFSDDDTDIEFVTLHALEKFGLGLTYSEITEMWIKHINRKIWVANKTARDLMAKGMIAPETGSKLHNKNWYQIDAQLVNEIWGVVYPGMTKQAAERSEWGAKITNDDWGTHPSIVYGVMYSAAFFEKDVKKLVQLALPYIPESSPFSEGIRDVLQWHSQNADWRETRRLIHEKYYEYKKGDYKAPVSVVSSLHNGLCGIMAILYGDGDFLKTTSIAVSAGYDCDNQAATCAGLIATIKGADSIPDNLVLGTSDKPLWEKPFNDSYINMTRDDLPVYTKISDIVSRIAAITEQAILANGGKKEMEDGKVIYWVNCN